MSLWLLLGVVAQIFMGLAIAVLWIRQTRPAKEDPRLSRGLQLLQSKISVLEDLSDRTENQVKQLTRILDERAKMLQSKMLQAEETIFKIEQSMHKSLDVAEIFQDKIPHEEIIERNQQSKYVLAAKMANEGHSLDEILAKVDLPRSEVEFIAKVNKDELTYDPGLLPEWAKTKAPSSSTTDFEAQMVDQVFHSAQTDFTALNQAEADFKQTVREAEEFERREMAKMRQKEERVKQIEAQAQALIKKVQFPKIYVDKKLHFPKINVDQS